MGDFGANFGQAQSCDRRGWRDEMTNQHHQVDRLLMQANKGQLVFCAVASAVAAVVVVVSRKRPPPNLG